MASGISLFNLLTEEFRDMTFVNTVAAMNHISYEIETVVMNNFLAVDFYAGFQRYSYMHAQRARYERLANIARRVYVFGIPDDNLPPVSGIEYIPLAADAALAEEWFLVVNTPYFYTTLITKEVDGPDPITGQRRFQGAWTFDERIVNQAYLLITQFLGQPYRPVRQRDYESQSRYASEIANKLIGRLEKTNLARSHNARLVQAMTAVSTTAASNLEPEQMLDAVIANLRDQFKARTATLWQPSPRQSEISLQAAAGLPLNWRDGAYRQQPTTNMGLVAVQAYNERQTVYIPNAQEQNRSDLFDPAAKSIIGVPIKARGQLLGVLQLTSAAEDAFAKSTQSTLGAIASQLGVTMLLLDQSSPLELAAPQSANTAVSTPAPAATPAQPALAPMPATPSPAQGMSYDAKMSFIEQVETGTPQYEPVQIKELVADLRQQFQSLAQGRQIELEDRTQPDMPPIEADREQIRQALGQLIDNAIKYSGDGQQVHILSNVDGDSAVLAVRDTGRGIPMSDLPYVFDSGYRSPGETIPGHGLGLSMVKAVADKHHGRAWIRSKPNQGSIVFVRIPLVQS